jgi:hypothetical protein
MSFNNPTPLPGWPFADLDSEIIREARKLYDDAVAQREQLGKIGVQHREEQAQLVQARAALEVERLKPDPDPDAVLALADDVRRRELLADHGTFRARAAQQEQDAERAVIRYRDFCRAHGPELLAELVPEAERAAGKLAAAIAKLAPFQADRGDIAGRVTALTSTFHNGSVDHVQAWAPNADETQPPLPRADVIAWFANELEPSPVAVEPEVAVAGGQQWDF